MKTIMITGASSGIGRATAETFLKAGWRVGLIARRADALAETTAQFVHLLYNHETWCDRADQDAEP